MGLMFTTVIGYMAVLGISATLIMYYLVKVFDSSESVKVDPKPETKF